MTQAPLDPRTGEEIARTVVPPPAPWRMRGRLHMGLFPAPPSNAPVPAGLRALLPGHRVVALVRYLEGTLQYDELVIGRLARHGVRLGFFVDHIWVDSAESVAGGRLFWGLPKEPARFVWRGDVVDVSDRDGDIGTLHVDSSLARGPTVPMIAPGFGVRDGQLLSALGKLRIRLRSSSLRVERWAARFDDIARAPRMGIDAAPFEMVIAEGRVL